MMAEARSHLKSMAFTLIELLFVIAIIGVMASFGLSLVEKQTKEMQVKKTALQLQQVLQAAMVYYNDTGYKWPPEALASSNSTCAEDDPDPVTEKVNPLCQYIPLNKDATLGLRNAWGLGYSWGEDKDIKPEGDAKTPIPYAFDVQTYTYSEAEAERLAALLPNAVVGTETIGGQELSAVTVRITEPPPPPNKDIVVGGAGIAGGPNNSNWCLDFHCASDRTPEFLFGPRQFAINAGGSDSKRYFVGMEFIQTYNPACKSHYSLGERGVFARDSSGNLITKDVYIQPPSDERKNPPKGYGFDYNSMSYVVLCVKKQ